MTKTFTYGTLKIDILNSSDALVPTEAIEIELEAQDRKALAIALTQNLPALLIGETGTGKTSAIKQLAFLRKQPYVRVNMTGFTTPDELIGSKSVKDGATYYENGIITNAMQRGAILVIDEINATTPDCLFILHGLLDEDRRITLPNGDIVTPHKDFRVFATCNPDYEGTKSMNKAFVDRFPIILAIDILNPKKEEALLVDRTGIEKDYATNLVIIATKARSAYIENKISTIVSTRSLLSIANLTIQGLKPLEAYTTSIIRKTSNKEEQAILKDFFMSVMKINDATSPNKPVITTQHELDGFRERIRTLEATADNYFNEKRSAEDTLAIAQEKHAIAEHQLKTIQEELEKTKQTATEQAQTILTYKKLDDMIKGIANTTTKKPDEEEEERVTY